MGPRRIRTLRIKNGRIVLKNNKGRSWNFPGWRDPLNNGYRLNQSMRDPECLDEQINFIDAELLLLDHHISGEVSASKFDWYMLDISKSATAITYSWLRESFKFDVEGDYLTLVPL